MKKVLIIGANRGLGLGFVKYYLENGFKVYATARASSDIKSLKDLSARFNEALNIYELHVDNEDSIGKFVNKLTSETLYFDIVINSAGVCIEEAFGKWTAQGFYEQISTNLIGAALVSQAIISFLSKGSKLIQLTSGMGSIELNINPEIGLDAYAVSKCGLNMLTRRLSEKVRNKGIIVVAINPGWVQTDMGGSSAPTPISVAIKTITKTINSLSIVNSGDFISTDGKKMPW